MSSDTTLGPIESGRSVPLNDSTFVFVLAKQKYYVFKMFMNFYIIILWPNHSGCTIGYSDYDVFLENDEGSRVYRCKKLF